MVINSVQNINDDILTTLPMHNRAGIYRSCIQIQREHSLRFTTAALTLNPIAMDLKTLSK